MPKGKKTGKVRDKWRDKKWLVVYAPTSFGNQPVAYIPVTDEAKAVGRVIEMALFDISKSDPQHHAIKLFFQIERIEGDKAYTRFQGHEYAREFLRSLVRRGSSLLNYVGDYTTADGYKFRVSTIAFTHRRVNTSKKKMIRSIINEWLSREIPKLTIDQFVQAVVWTGVNASLQSQIKRIISMRHTAVRKTKLMSWPKVQAEQKLQVEATPQ